jgi:CheY-like chemotaxis protein
MPVLVVDDNATNRFILSEILSNWRMQPTAVASGPEAIDTLLQMSRAGKPFPLVLTDINMPRMDGFALASQIRQTTDLSDTIIIALTSSGRAEDAERREQVGIAAELLKPVKQSELMNAITMAVVPTAIGQPAVEPVALDSRPTTETMHILLAEDGISNQKLAIGLLENWGHRVKVANNGREAVDLWSQHPFDLVLMDVQMPDMDGLEATRIIRHRERQTGQHTPIVAMTAHAMKGDRDKCLASGMDGYVSKPVRMQELYDAIRPFADRTQPRSTETPPARDSRTEIDWNAALESTGGDARLLREVAQEALRELPRLSLQLSQAISNLNAPVVQRIAHTIKGTVRMFGAEHVGQLAESIETRARDNELQLAGQVVEGLRTELDGCIAALETFVTSGRD